MGGRYRYLSQIRVGVKFRIEFLCVDFPILVQDVSINLGDHLNFRMAGIALSGLDVTVIELQLVGRAGMPERIRNTNMIPNISSTHCCFGGK